MPLQSLRTPPTRIIFLFGPSPAGRRAGLRQSRIRSGSPTDGLPDVESRRNKKAWLTHGSIATKAISHIPLATACGYRSRIRSDSYHEVPLSVGKDFHTECRKYREHESRYGKVYDRGSEKVEKGDAPSVSFFIHTVRTVRVP